MPSESSFQHRSLSCTLYETAIQRLRESLPDPLGAMFAQCQLGIAPGPDRRNMLFAIAESLTQVEQLSLHIELISDRVAQLLPGVARIALCVRPSADGRMSQNAIPQQVVGRIFELETGEVDTSD